MKKQGLICFPKPFCWKIGKREEISPKIYFRRTIVRSLAARNSNGLSYFFPAFQPAVGLCEHLELFDYENKSRSQLRNSVSKYYCDAGRWKTLGAPAVVKGGQNLPTLDWLGLTDLQNIIAVVPQFRHHWVRAGFDTYFWKEKYFRNTYVNHIDMYIVHVRIKKLFRVSTPFHPRA